MPRSAIAGNSLHYASAKGDTKMPDIQNFLTITVEFIVISSFLLMALNCIISSNPPLPPVQLHQPEALSPLADTETITLPVPLSTDKQTVSAAPAAVPISLVHPNAVEDVDPWLLPYSQPPIIITTTGAAPQPLRPLPPAPGQLDPAALKLYKLHGKQVVLVEDITAALPPGLKSYKLHGKQVVRLADLELAIA